MSYQLKAAIEDASRGLPWTLTLTVQAYCNIRLICQDINAERRAIMAGRQIAEVK